MRSELKIGIVVGVVIVVGIIIFVVKNTQNDNDRNNQMNMNQDKTQLQSQGNVVQNPPDPIEPTPTNPSGDGTQDPPVESVEVVVKDDNESGIDKEVIPAVKEELIKPVVVVPEPEVKAPRYHVVKSGENLYTISEQYFGQGNQTAGTKAIQKANPDLIKDVDVIHPGWRLRIPYPEDIAP
jgi:LysM repeat protein